MTTTQLPRSVRPTTSAPSITRQPAGLARRAPLAMVLYKQQRDFNAVGLGVFASMVVGLLADIAQSHLHDAIAKVEQLPFVEKKVKLKLSELKKALKTNEHYIWRRILRPDGWSDFVDNFQNSLKDETALLKVAMKNNLDKHRLDYVDVHLTIMLADIYSIIAIDAAKAYNNFDAEMHRLCPVAPSHKLYQLREALVPYIGNPLTVTTDSNVRGFLKKLTKKILDYDMLLKSYSLATGIDLIPKEDEQDAITASRAREIYSDIRCAD